MSEAANAGRKKKVTHPWPPVLGGAPVSPSAMARAVVVKVARRGRNAAVLVNVVRSMMGNWDEGVGGEEEKGGVALG